MLRGLWFLIRAFGYLIVLAVVLNLPPFAIAVCVALVLVLVERRRRGVAS